jgi:hypothetical protein
MKTKEKLTKCKHFRHHLEYSRHFDFSRLATNFLQWKSVRSISKNHEFLCKKSAISSFRAILIFFFVKDEQSAKFKQS